MVLPTDPSAKPPSLLDGAGGGGGGGAGQPPGSRRGWGNTPTYIPQSDPHDALIIWNIDNWGNHQPRSNRRSGQGSNSIAFGKSTSQRIYPKQHTPKIGYKLHKYGLNHALHILDSHFR